jgi:hypothetical protein
MKTGRYYLYVEHKNLGVDEHGKLITPQFSVIPFDDVEPLYKAKIKAEEVGDMTIVLKPMRIVPAIWEAE